jgi:hypothetical protein
MEREKECIIPASGSYGCDRAPRSGAHTPCFVNCASSALRWQLTPRTPTTRTSRPRPLDL